MPAVVNNKQSIFLGTYHTSIIDIVHCASLGKACLTQSETPRTTRSDCRHRAPETRHSPHLLCGIFPLSPRPPAVIVKTACSINAAKLWAKRASTRDNYTRTLGPAPHASAPYKHASKTKQHFIQTAVAVAVPALKDMASCSSTSRAESSLFPPLLVLQPPQIRNENSR